MPRIADGEWIGWLSSLILFATIVKQVHKQWRGGTSEGVSKWLYLGQITAEAGFVVYSWQVGNWVFVVTNIMVLGANLLGLGLVYRHRRRDQRC